MVWQDCGTTKVKGHQTQLKGLINVYVCTMFEVDITCDFHDIEANVGRKANMDIINI